MKRVLMTAAAIGLSAGICLSLSACGKKSLNNAVPPDEAGSYSIVTKLDLGVYFDGDTAVAKVKNTFTFFPAEAKVHVHLYFSETEASSFEEMREVATEYTEDLDQGNTLTASWDTKGRGGYYMARMRYKIDARDWEEKCTELYYRDYTKAVLEKIEDDGSLPVVEDVERVVKTSNENIFYYSNHSIDEPYERYCEFEKKYEEKFGEPLDKEFLTLNFSDGKYHTTQDYISSIFLDKGSEDNYYLTSFVTLRIEEFGIYYEPEPGEIPGIRKNLELWFTSVNIDSKDLKGELRLEFGKFVNGGPEIYHKLNPFNFINVYIGDKFIANCIVSASSVKPFTYAFFYNMFVDALISNLDIK